MLLGTEMIVITPGRSMRLSVFGIDCMTISVVLGWFYLALMVI